MTRAEVDAVRPDVKAAVAFIKQAPIGRRVTAGEAGHMVLIGEARIRIGGEETLFDRLDRMRRTRHRVFYEVDEVSQIELDGARRDAGLLIDHAARFVHTQVTGD